MKQNTRHKDVIIAWLNGAEVQIRSNDGQWISEEDPLWNESCNYRVKPKPKLRPWRADEVPVGALYRRNTWVAGERSIIHWAGTNGEFSYQTRLHLLIDDVNEALHYGSYSTDGGKTWNPCGVLE